MKTGDIVTIGNCKTTGDRSLTRCLWRVLSQNTTHVSVEAADDKAPSYLRGPHLLLKAEYDFTPAGDLAPQAPTLNFNRPLQTRDGRNVRIYRTDAPGRYPIHGAILESDGLWDLTEWSRSGGYIFHDTIPNNGDLVNVPA